jgi:hypothetical protein
MEKSSAYEAGQAVGHIIIGLVVLMLFVGAFGFFIFAAIKACTRKTPGWIITAVTMAVLGLGGVVTSVVMFALVLNKEIGSANTVKAIASEDGRHSISIPGNWKSLPALHEEADIKAGNEFAGRYAIVFVESKEDLDMSLAKYAEFIADDMRESSGDTSTREPHELTVGGFPAIRHRISGTVDGMKITYHHTCVETPTSLCQIMCWSLKSDEKSAKPIFDKVAASFVEKKEG